MIVEHCGKECVHVTSAWRENTREKSEKDFCFCVRCRGEFFCHRTTIQRHFKRQEAFNSSFESHQDTSFEDTSFQDTETGSDVVEGWCPDYVNLQRFHGALTMSIYRDFMVP